jgi:uncharacterized protein YecT (DUF1311 family)
MIKIIAILLLISGNVAAQAPQPPYDPCEDELNIESTLARACNMHKEIRKLEKDLDIDYKASLKLALESGFLVNAQEKWIQFREANCSMEQAEYGGMNSVNYLSCRAQMTSERIKYLKEFFPPIP